MSVAVNGVTQTNGVTPADFRRSLRYVVTASDNSTSIYNVAAALPAVGFGSAALLDGNGPDGVAAQDLDGDGAPDILLAQINGWDTLLFANATVAGATAASFASAVPFNTPSGHPAGTVAIADFNGDGNPDFAVNDGVISVFVYVNTTLAAGMQPTFSTPDSYMLAASTGPVTAADINGDGRPDLVLTNGATQALEVLVNTTLPGASTTSFGPMAAFAVGAAPTSMAVADFDGDGLLDVTTSNNNDNTLSVLLNTTTPGGMIATFAPSVTFDAPSLPRSVTAADVNLDGKPDLLVAENSSGAVAVLLNTTAAPGNATFATPVLFATDICPVALVVLDINADGSPDIATANDCPDSVSFLINTTIAGSMTPSFQTHVELPAGPSPIAITAADVNGDNLVDLIVAEHGNGTVSGGVSVLLGK